MQRVSPILMTLLGTVLLALSARYSMYFITAILGVPIAYWLVPIFGALGGAVGSVLRNENRLVLCSRENASTINLGILGDIIIGLGGSAGIVFLFGGTLKFDPRSPESYVLLISVSFISGVFGRNVVEAAGQRLKRELREEAKEVAKQEAKMLVGPPAAVAYTYSAKDTTNKGAPEKALELVDLALQNDPTYVNAYIEKGRALKRLGRIEQALATVEEGLRIKSDDPKALYNRACYKCLLARSNEEVLSDLRKAIELAPTLAESAAEDGDFQRIRDLKEFKELVTPKEA